jgi:hypothetical protein
MIKIVIYFLNIVGRKRDVLYIHVKWILKGNVERKVELAGKWTIGRWVGEPSALPFVINAPSVRHERPSAVMGLQVLTSAVT